MNHLLSALTPAPASDLEIWTRWSLQIVTVVTGFIVTLYTIKRKQDKIEGKVDKAATDASRAAELALPTGNGFAAKTLDGQKQILDALVRLSDRQDQTNKTLMQHLAHHVEKESK